MKDTFYFSHDYNARSDDKIKLLIRKHGMIGYGVFWAIVEDLYNNANALRLDCEGIAYDLHVDVKIVENIIFDFELFVIENNFFGSLSVERRLNERNEKSEKARKSALNRWNKTKDDANAMRTQCEGYAIKERKGKEIKERIYIDLGQKIQENSTKNENKDILLNNKGGINIFNADNSLKSDAEIEEEQNKLVYAKRFIEYVNYIRGDSIMKNLGLVIGADKVVLTKLIDVFVLEKGAVMASDCPTKYKALEYFQNWAKKDKNRMDALARHPKIIKQKQNNQ